MKLILAEKDAAARKIAHVLSGGRYRTVRQGKISYYVFGDTVVFPLRGHLLDVDFPPRFSSWRMEDLPLLVESPLVVKERDPARLRVLRRLMRACSEVIIATDADREGEAIGLEVVDGDKKVSRAWFSSLTPQEIRRAFSNLRSPNYALAHSAFARRDVDLLWGAVLTRALSLKTNRRGRDFLSVGRVQTPTLALVVEREREIRSFVPEKYYVVVGEAEGYRVVCDKKFKNKEEAQEIAKNKRGVVVSVEERVVEVPRPVPFDTNTFLREASRLLKISPKRALDVAEELYLRGLISYPRTDNQTYPPMDFSSILSLLEEAYPIVKNIRPPYRPSSGRKTEDHPPIHPVGYERLEGIHARVYDLVARRFIATLLPPGRVKVRRVVIEAGCGLVGEGREVVERGWTAVYPHELKTSPLPPFQRGQEVSLSLSVEERKTQPPPRYTYSTLLSKMESLGLGTKSTRAEIIDKLFKRGYLTGKKVIRPTELGEAVYDILKGIVPVIVGPGLTASLEEELERVAKGQEGREEVVARAREVLRKVVNDFLARDVGGVALGSKEEPVGKRPGAPRGAKKVKKEKGKVAKAHRGRKKKG